MPEIHSHNGMESLILGQQSFEVAAKIHMMKSRWSVRMNGSEACHLGMLGRAWICDWLTLKLPWAQSR